MNAPCVDVGGTPVRPLRKVAWKVYQLTPRIASVRYRCLIPALALEQRGVQSTVFEEGEVLTDLEDFDLLIFVKSFTASDARLAALARRYGIPVVLDLCDNIFVAGYATDAPVSPIEGFHRMAAMSGAIVVPTEPLASRTAMATGGAAQIFTIPDPLETPDIVARLLSGAAPYRYRRDRVVPRAIAFIPYRLLARVAPALRGLARWLDPTGRVRRLVFRSARSLLATPTRIGRALQHPRATLRGALDRARRAFEPSPSQMSTAAPKSIHARTRKQVLWFGQHGAPHSKFGMESLEALLPVLEDVNQSVPIELIVVSNNFDRFAALERQVSFPCRYSKWTLEGIFAHLRECDVCVMPNPRDEFSITKSANRAALALSMGVPVVATSIPSFLPFADCIALDNWKGGLLAYLTDDARRRRDVDAAQSVLAREYDSEVIAERWRNLIDTLSDA